MSRCKSNKLKYILILCSIIGFIFIFYISHVVLKRIDKANKTFIISQAEDVLELGTDYDLIKCLEYDKENIMELMT